ncbi:MAG: glycosyltransferase family 4 protein, partial [Planctomycetes bacterium]|nr:glycosyltransferase family 4 protein [Planctomycetota bacterium]
FFKRLLLCRDSQINDRKVISLPTISLVSKLRTYINQRGVNDNLRFRLEKWESIYYGKRTKKYIRPEVKLIHSRSGYSRAIISYAGKMGIKILLEQSAAHPKFANKILEQEYDKWEVRKKYRTYVDPAKEMQWDLENADYILTNSDFCADTIRPNVKYPDKIRVVYTGVDVNAFKPSNENKNTNFTILYVGSVNINKGIIYLLKAFKKLGLPKAKLIVIGKRSSDLPKEFDSYNGLYDYIPFVPHNELSVLMAQTSVFVLPSLAEGSARVVGEAMACGLACIVTPNCGSTISDGDDGFFVPIKDEDALAEKILCLYRNRELCHQVGTKAREKIVNTLTWDHYKQNLLKVYRQIIDNGK